MRAHVRQVTLQDRFQRLAHAGRQRFALPERRQRCQAHPCALQLRSRKAAQHLHGRRCVLSDRICLTGWRGRAQPPQHGKFAYDLALQRCHVRRLRRKRLVAGEWLGRVCGVADDGRPCLFERRRDRRRRLYATGEP